MGKSESGVQHRATYQQVQFLAMHPLNSQRRIGAVPAYNHPVTDLIPIDDFSRRPIVLLED